MPGGAIKPGDKKQEPPKLIPVDFFDQTGIVKKNADQRADYPEGDKVEGENIPFRPLRHEINIKDNRRGPCQIQQDGRAVKIKRRGVDVGIEF